jgi:hypothetical protein
MKIISLILILNLVLSVSNCTSQSNSFSIQFDNIDDYIDFGTHNLKQAYTVSFWIKIINPSLLGIGLMHKNPCSRGKGFHLSATIYASYNCPNPCNPFGCGQFYQLDYTDPINSQWKYKTISNDGQGHLKLYLNGILVDELTDSQSVFPTDSYPLWLGKTQDDNVFFGNTIVDNLEYWDVCLSAEEISNYMNCPPTGNESGLWGFWNFEAGTGNVVVSSGSTSLTGQLMNGASWSTDVPTITCGNNGNETIYGNEARFSAPEAISYQAVARNAQGQPLSDASVQVRFTLLTDSLTGAAEYSESHSLTTNSLGLFTTAFGAGAPDTGTFANINWASGSKYLKVELDAGTGFVDMGTQQLLSVPYSMRSNTSAKAGTIENAGLPVYADNAAALAGGLLAGQMYRTPGGVLMIVY